MTIENGLGLLGGLALFLYGMQMMSTGLEAAAGNKMKLILEKITANRFVGVLVGALITAVIQSSSASVGILQALANSGALSLNSAAFVLFGQNIGTCVTALLASVGASRNAKRTTIIHISFNVFGTMIFTVLCLVTPIIFIVEGWSSGDVSKQIANLHTTFNIVTTCMLLPIGTLLPKLATFILKDREESEATVRTMYLLDMKHISAEKLGGSVILVENVKKELYRMLAMTKENVQAAFDIFTQGSSEDLKKIEECEEYVDFLNKEISKYITNAAAYENTNNGSKIFNALFAITSNIERIGDHALNISNQILKIAMAEGK